MNTLSNVVPYCGKGCPFPRDGGPLKGPVLWVQEGKNQVCTSITELCRRAETWVTTWSFSDTLPKVEQGGRQRKWVQPPEPTNPCLLTPSEKFHRDRSVDFHRLTMPCGLPRGQRCRGLEQSVAWLERISSTANYFMWQWLTAKAIQEIHKNQIGHRP